MATRTAHRRPSLATLQDRRRTMLALRRLWRRALADARDTLLVSEIEAAARARSRPRLLTALLASVEALETTLSEGLPAILLAALRRGADRAQATLPPRTRRLGRAESDLLTDAVAVAWVTDHATEIIRAIGDESEAALRALVERAMVVGIAARTIATLARSVLGLSVAQSEKVLALEDAIRTGEPGERIPAGPRTVTVPSNGATVEFVEGAVAAYAASVVTSRLTQFAMTTSAEADSDGKDLVWQAAITRGELTRDTEKILVQVEPCEDCQEIADEGPLPVDASWSVPGPPFHRNCQCEEVLVSAGEDDS